MDLRFATFRMLRQKKTKQVPKEKIGESAYKLGPQKTVLHGFIRVSCITITPKPELRAFWKGFPYFSPPFGATSAEVAILCSKVYNKDVSPIKCTWV